MAKKLFSLLLSLVMVISLFPAAAMAAELAPAEPSAVVDATGGTVADVEPAALTPTGGVGEVPGPIKEHDMSGHPMVEDGADVKFVEFISALGKGNMSGGSFVLSGGAYYLETDYVDDGAVPLNISITGDVYLCLNGSQLDVAKGCALNIEKGATLYVCDYCHEEANWGEILAPINKYGNLVVYSGIVNTGETLPGDSIAPAATEHKHADGTVFAPLKLNLSGDTELKSGNYYVVADGIVEGIDFYGNVNIQSSEKVKICLAGLTVKTQKHSIINWGALEICNCQSAGVMGGSTPYSIVNHGALTIDKSMVVSIGTAKGTVDLTSSTVQAIDIQNGAKGEYVQRISVTGGRVESIKGIYDPDDITASEGIIIGPNAQVDSITTGNYKVKVTGAAKNKATVGKVNVNDKAGGLEVGAYGDVGAITNMGTVNISSGGQSDDITNMGSVHIYDGGVTGSIEQSGNGAELTVNGTINGSVKVLEGSVTLEQYAAIKNEQGGEQGDHLILGYSKDQNILTCNVFLKAIPINVYKVALCDLNGNKSQIGVGELLVADAKAIYNVQEDLAKYFTYNGEVPANVNVVTKQKENSVYFEAVDTSVEAHTHTVDGSDSVSFSPLSEKVLNGVYSLGSGAYYLDAGVTNWSNSILPGITITGNVDLCLNNSKLVLAMVSDKITVKEGATLRICDCPGTSIGAIAPTIDNAGATYVYSGTVSEIDNYGSTYVYSGTVSNIRTGLANQTKVEVRGGTVESIINVGTYIKNYAAIDIYGGKVNEIINDATKLPYGGATNIYGGKVGTIKGGTGGITNETDTREGKYVIRIHGDGSGQVDIINTGADYIDLERNANVLMATVNENGILDVTANTTQSTSWVNRVTVENSGVLNVDRGRVGTINNAGSVNIVNDGKAGAITQTDGSLTVGNGTINGKITATGGSVTLSNPVITAATDQLMLGYNGTALTCNVTFTSAPSRNYTVALCNANGTETAINPGKLLVARIIPSGNYAGWFSYTGLTPENVEVKTLHENGAIYFNATEAIAGVAKNLKTGMTYETAAEALSEAQAGQTVQMINNSGENTTLLITPGVTLDLNGKILNAQYVVGFAGSQVKDDSGDNAGILRIAQANMKLDKGNKQVPVWSVSGKGYVFAEFADFFTKVDDTAEDSLIFYHVPYIEPSVHSDLINSAQASGVKIVVRLTWADDTYNEATQNFVYTDAQVKRVFENYQATGKFDGATFMASFTNIWLTTGTDMKLSAGVISDAGAEFYSELIDVVAD